MENPSDGYQGRTPRPDKVAVVDEVRERLEASNAALLTEYRGLKVSDLAELRRNVNAAGGDYKIYKNTLVRLAVRELGVEGIEDLLIGPTAIAFVNGDTVAVAKVLRDYARTNPNLVLKGGVLDDRPISAEEIGALASLPPREELLARIAGGLAAPMQQFASLLQALPRNMAYGLKALIDIGGAPGAPVDEAPAAADDTPAEAPADAAPEAAAEAPADAAPEAVAEAPADAAPDTAAEAPADAAPETEAAPAAEATTESAEEA